MLNKQFIQIILAIVTLIWVINFFSPLFPGGSNLRNGMIDTIFMGTVGAAFGFEAAKSTRTKKRSTDKDPDQDQDGTP